MPKKLKELRLKDEHQLKFGFNDDGDFILTEYFSNTSSHLENPDDIAEFTWLVELIIKKSVCDANGIKRLNFFKNLHTMAKRHYDDYLYDGHTLQIQLAFTETNIDFFSKYFEECLQEDRIDYVKKLINT